MKYKTIKMKINKIKFKPKSNKIFQKRKKSKYKELVFLILK